MTPARPLHDHVLAIIDDLALIDGEAGLSDAQLQTWMTKLSSAQLRCQRRLFLDCVEASMRFEQAGQTRAALQLLMLSGVGLSDGQRASSWREGGDVWARMRPSRFSVVC